MAVLGRLAVDGVREVQLLDDDTRAQVEVLLDDFDELFGGLVRGAVGLNEKRKGLSYANGVGQLNEGATGQPGVNERLGDPARKVGSGAVNLGVVLAGESTSAVGSPPSIGINNDLAAGEAGITLGTTDDEETGWLDVVDGPVIQVLGRNNLLDDLLLYLLSELLGGDILAVLGRDDDGIYAERYNSATIVGILDRDLGLGVGAQPREAAVVAGLLHGVVELVRQQDGQGQQLRSLVSGISEHDALITGTKLLHGLIVMKTLGNIGRLLLDGDKDVAGLVVEALLGVVIADVFDGIADDLLVVEVGLGGDLAKDHDHASLSGRLTSDLGERVLPEAGIEDGVGDLIAEGGG